MSTALPIRTYTGVGSREITDTEQYLIEEAAVWLRAIGYAAISGNAEGADIAFQEASDGCCYLMLPWVDFNAEEYDPSFSRGTYVVGDETEGQRMVDQCHPNPDRLSRGARALLARNYYQVAGYRDCPKSDFILCCADPDAQGVRGGTGHTVRIGHRLHVPYFNIREDHWQERLIDHLREIGVTI